MSSDPIANAALTDSSKRRLRGLVADGVRGSLLIVEAASSETASAGGAAVGQALLSPAARDLDVRVVAPEKDSWSLDEIMRDVVGAAAHTPTERNVVVVEHADAMAPAAADHLLKTVEEPPAPSLFVFCVPTTAALSATLLGRASAVVAVEAPSAADRVADMVAAGVERDVAMEIADLCGPLASVALAVAADPDLLDDLRVVLGGSLWATTPTSRAVELAGSARRLGEAVAGPKADEVVIKARVRSIIRAAIDRWRAELVTICPGLRDHHRFAIAWGSAAALDTADVELRSYTPPTQVLAALFSRVGPIRP